MYYQQACNDLICATLELRKANAIIDELDIADPNDMIDGIETCSYRYDMHLRAHFARNQLMTGDIHHATRDH